MSASKYVTIGGSHRLGTTLCDKLQFDRDEMKKKMDEKARVESEAYRELCRKADKVLKDKGDVHPSNWSINELKEVIRPLKEKGKGKDNWPKLKQDLVKMYFTMTTTRVRRPLEQVVET